MTQTPQDSHELLFSNIGFLLGKTNQIKDRFLDQYLVEEEITSGQVKVLFRLYLSNNQRSSDISKALGVDGGAMTRMLDRLEKKHFIQRIADPDDRRSVLIQLTDTGQVVTSRALPLAQAAINNLTECLTTEEKQNLLHCLSKIVSSSLSEECHLSNKKDEKC
tara:strand:- start:8186 stop:8674 length:489 start_codon:yes stop_codon:yes gene_type:complete